MKKSGKNKIVMMIIILQTVFLFACSEKTVWLDETPEYCFEGTAIQTVDHIDSFVFYMYEYGSDQYVYHTNSALETFVNYTAYLNDLGYNASPYTFEKAEYKTEYGRFIISVSYNQKYNIDDRSGTIIVKISR